MKLKNHIVKKQGNSSDLDYIHKLHNSKNKKNKKKN